MFMHQSSPHLLCRHGAQNGVDHTRRRRLGKHGNRKNKKKKQKIDNNQTKPIYVFSTHVPLLCFLNDLIPFRLTSLPIYPKEWHNGLEHEQTYLQRIPSFAFLEIIPPLL
jgi:hypothetical protein